MLKPRSRLPLLVLAWLATVLVATAVVQLAAQSERFASIAEWLISLACCAIVVLAGGGVGRSIVGERGDAAERVALSIGIGLGALSAATLVLGLIGALRIEIGWALLAIAIAAFRRSIRAWLSDWAVLRPALAAPRGLARWAAIYCAFALGLAFLHALAPATAWDALTYHLKGPELYLVAGRIGQPIDLPLLGFPQFQEMLYLLARLIGAPNVALLHWVFVLATVLLIYSLARRLGGESIGWIAAAVFLSAQSIVWLAGWPYIDLTLAFHVTAAFACLRRWREDGDIAWLRLGGVFTGFAMATKYTAALVVAGLIGVVIWTGLRRSRVGIWRCLVQYGGPAVLAVLPWYVKNLIVTGNPVYPFFFDGLYWDSLRAAYYSHFGTGLAFTSPWRLLTAPIEATIFGAEGRDPYGATIGPLFLMLVPVGIAGLRRLPHLQDAAIVCGVGYLGWLALIASSASFVQTRLLFPIFPLLAVIAAGGFDWLRQSAALTIGVQRLVSAAVAVSLLLSALGLTLEFGASGVTAVLSGDQPRQDYLVDRLGWYALAMDSINRLPAGSQVMFLWEPRSLYCRIDCRPDAMLDRWWHARRTIGSPDAIAQAWRAAGVTHVLLHRAGYQFFASAEFDPISADDQAALASLIGAHLSLAQDFDGVYELYSLRPEK